MIRRAFIGGALAWVAVANAGPLLAMLGISLLDRYPALPGVAPRFSLAAYEAVWAGPGHAASLGRSVLLAASATGLALLVAFPLAYHVARHVPPARRARRLLLLAAPFWAGEVVRLSGLLLLLSNRGALNGLLQAAGLVGAPLPLLYGAGSLLAGMVYTVLLTMLLPVYAALERLPPGLLDAAEGLGAGPVQRLVFVVLPLAGRGIGVGCVLSFLAGLGLLAAPALLDGAGTPSFAGLVAGAFAASSGQWPLGAALGVVLMLAGVGGALVLAGWARRVAA